MIVLQLKTVNRLQAYNMLEKPSEIEVKLCNTTENNSIQMFFFQTKLILFHLSLIVF